MPANLLKIGTLCRIFLSPLLWAGSGCAGLTISERAAEAVRDYRLIIVSESAIVRPGLQIAPACSMINKATRQDLFPRTPFERRLATVKVTFLVKRLHVK
jgi:hypothetical protein